MNKKLLTHRKRDKNLKTPITGFCQLYSSTTEDNLRAIGEILEDVRISDSIPIDQFKNMLERSSQNLMDKWSSGRKSLRTEIAFKILPEYPSAVLKTSLIIDAIIDSLDDNLDELMTKEERMLNIVELVRTTAIFNQLPVSDAARKKALEYFNKLLCIGISEILYKEKIKMLVDFKQQLHNSIKCYDCKSLVMDIFFELPLIELYGDDKNIKNIVSLARVHRAVCLIKKDFQDLEHDSENQTETPLVILSEKGKELLKKYMDAMMDYYERKNKKFEPGRFNGDFQLITKRLQELISKEIAGYRNEGFMSKSFAGSLV